MSRRLAPVHNWYAARVRAGPLCQIGAAAQNIWRSVRESNPRFPLDRQVPWATGPTDRNPNTTTVPCVFYFVAGATSPRPQFRRQQKTPAVGTSRGFSAGRPQRVFQPGLAEDLRHVVFKARARTGVIAIERWCGFEPKGRERSGKHQYLVMKHGRLLSFSRVRRARIIGRCM